MHTYIIGKNMKILMNEECCPGINIRRMDLHEAELEHMCCRMEQKIYFLYIVRGSLKLQSNQERVDVSRGEGLFINRNTFFRFDGGSVGGCEFYLFEISSSVLEEPLVKKYMQTIQEDISFSYMKIYLRGENQKRFLEILEHTGRTAEVHQIGCELEVKSGLYELLAVFARIYLEEKPNVKKSIVKEADKLRRMLLFIHENYKVKITLTEIAENLGVSSGDYCRFFKKHMGQTPFEYLQAYRIEKSIPDLLEKESSISEFALQHGFNGSSYYAEIFRKEMGCTPGEFRKWYLGVEENNCPLKNSRMENDKRKNGRTVSNIQQSMPAHLL